MVDDHASTQNDDLAAPGSVTRNDEPEAAIRSEVAEVLANLDQGRCNLLLIAFNNACFGWEATNVEVMWALAMLQAQVLARAEIGGEQIWAATRMGEMLRIALPGAIMQAQQGRPQDA
jgi:hypothetical protein